MLLLEVSRLYTRPSFDTYCCRYLKQLAEEALGNQGGTTCSSQLVCLTSVMSIQLCPKVANDLLGRTVQAHVGSIEPL